MDFSEINKRYTGLADSSCCLSCGGAIDHSVPKEGEICVDLGSGRGTDAMRLAESVGKNGYVYGIDLSDGMIRKSRDTAERLGVQNVKFIQSELEKIDIESDKIDLAISNCTINHAREKQKVWDEIFRILKKGGRFVVSDIYSPDPVPEEYADDPVSVSECWAGAVTREAYLSHLHKAGFEKIRILEESLPYEKGKIKVASWTIQGFKPAPACSCGQKSNCCNEN